MTEEKNINKSALILHSVLICLLLAFNDSASPQWFLNSLNPEEVFSTEEYVILTIAIFPGLLLFGLWFKSLFNTIVPKIFNFREINYWEAYGLTLLLSIIQL